MIRISSQKGKLQLELLLILLIISVLAAGFSIILPNVFLGGYSEVRKQPDIDVSEAVLGQDVKISVNDIPESTCKIRLKILNPDEEVFEQINLNSTEYNNLTIETIPHTGNWLIKGNYSLCKYSDHQGTYNISKTPFNVLEPYEVQTTNLSNQSVTLLQEIQRQVRPGWYEFASLVLLITTAVLSVNTLVFQRRTGIRESLEQLDDILFKDHWKMKPILHKFSLREWHCIISIKFYYIRRKDIAGLGEIRRDIKNLVDFDLSELEERDYVEEAKYEDGEIRVKISSLNAVLIRKVAEDIIFTIEKGH